MAHKSVLDRVDYETCVEIFGPTCGICGAEPKPGKKLHRDHEHSGDGIIRGLLCWQCNGWLPNRITAEWLDEAAAYLRRAEQQRVGAL